MLNRSGPWVVHTKCQRCAVVLPPSSPSRVWNFECLRLLHNSLAEPAQQSGSSDGSGWERNESHTCSMGIHDECLLRDTAPSLGEPDPAHLVRCGAGPERQPSTERARIRQHSRHPPHGFCRRPMQRKGDAVDSRQRFAVSEGRGASGGGEDRFSPGCFSRGAG